MMACWAWLAAPACGPELRSRLLVGQRWCGLLAIQRSSPRRPERGGTAL
eukprot:COSAG01_NODE_10461_length_2160_cov_3.470160_2_plen_49_part_00